jgi:hypothetical protein
LHEKFFFFVASDKAFKKLSHYLLNKMQEVLESYRKIRLLGRGSFGKAFLVECTSDKVRD